ncbi:MAG: galactokinase [Propionibacteriaceae bacterium]|nr:galactokinase [Propionibacteriaceae bacterium]
MSGALLASTSLFEDTFGTPAQVMSRGPGRVNLIGEHTDYNDGYALPFAIDRSTVAGVRLREDRTIRLATAFAPGVVETHLDDLADAGGLGWAAYPIGVVLALGDLGADLASVPGFDVAFSSDVPVGAGLSSSAAIESAMAVALDRLWQLHFDRRTLARAGQKAENEVVGAPTGILDQSASLLSQTDSAVLLDCRSLTTSPVPLALEEHGLCVLVIDTKVSHAHADGGYGARRSACEQGARRLGVSALRDVKPADLDFARVRLDDVTFRRVRHVVTENQRVLDTVDRLATRGPTAIGELLVASHASMRDDFEISTPEQDRRQPAAILGKASERRDWPGSSV